MQNWLEKWLSHSIGATQFSPQLMWPEPTLANSCCLPVSVYSRLSACGNVLVDSWVCHTLTECKTTQLNSTTTTMTATKSMMCKVCTFASFEQEMDKIEILLLSLYAVTLIEFSSFGRIHQISIARGPIIDTQSARWHTQYPRCAVVVCLCSRARMASNA